MKRIISIIFAALLGTAAMAGETPQVVGTIPGIPGGDTVELTNAVVPFCAEGTFLVVYTIGDNAQARTHNAVGKAIPGCWGVNKGKVRMVFVDGDAGEIATDKIQWVEGKRPAQHLI